MSFWDFLPRIKYAVLLNPSYLFAQIIVLKTFNLYSFVSTGMYFRSTICRSEFLVAKSVEGFSPRSIAYYHQILKQFFASTTTQFPNQSLKCISSDVVRWYLAMRSVLGKVSKVTLNNERRVLSSFFHGHHQRDMFRSIRCLK